MTPLASHGGAGLIVHSSHPPHIELQSLASDPTPPVNMLHTNLFPVVTPIVPPIPTPSASKALWKTVRTGVADAH